MNAVVNSSEIRNAYESCLPMISKYYTWMGQHKELYKAYKAIKESAEYSQLNQAQKKTLDNEIRDFKLSGIDLPAEQQQRYGEISKRLSELSSQFSNNVLDATMAWTKHIANKAELAGMPESALAAASAEAKAKNLDGYLLTLDHPSYAPVMTYCDNEDLRKEIFEAFMTKASELGPNAGQYDNTDIMEEKMKLRYEIAQLLGFKNYSELSLATKMAKDPEQVFNFLNDLAVKAKPQGEKELAYLHKFAEQEFSVTDLKRWDISYYREKQQQHLFNFSDEDLRPYFPETKVIDGLFEVLNRLYDIKIKERKGVDTWHKDVRFFDIFDKNNTLRGSFYFDLYARENKRGGAWMAKCKSRRIDSAGNLQVPVAYLTCNFTKPIDNKPALFTHREVITLFHETGHGLHHMLTKVDEIAVSGLNGVPWDAVELPSQFLENWCWKKEALEFISGHYVTNQTLPADLLDKMLAAKNFQSAMFILRQLKLGLFDFTLHTNYEPSKGLKLAETIKEVDTKVSLLPELENDRYFNSFNHIFAGGYCAGYYSYLWAEVLSADAFSRFEEEGIFNKKTGQDFLENILEMGGSEESIELFKRFRGREPKINAMLRHKGINA